MSNLVPDGWSNRKLGEFTAVVNSKNKDLKNIPVLSVTKYNGFVNSNKYFNKQVFSRDLSGYKIVKKEEFAYSTVHLDEGAIGFLDYLEAGLVSPMYTIFKTKGDIDNAFLFAMLKSDEYVLKYSSIGQGSIDRRSSVPFKAFSDLDFKYPPLPEQQKIAAILTSVDEVIEKTQAQIDKLKDLKTGMMQELLTVGVGIDGTPHTEFKDSPVGRIPKGWEVKPLAEVVERVIDCEHKTAPYVEKSEYMVVRTSNVRNGELVFDDMKFTHSDGYAEWTKRAVPSSGDVMFTREAPAGESCLVPDDLNVCLGQRMVLLRPNTDVILPCFFSLFLTSVSAVKSIYELSIGTTVSRINIEDIKKVPCALPTLKEQKKISNSIQSVQKLLSVKQNKLKSLNMNKKALMQDLLTGKVLVNTGASSSPQASSLKASLSKAN